MSLAELIRANPRGRRLACTAYYDGVLLPEGSLLGAEASFALSGAVASGSCRVNRLPEGFDHGHVLELAAGWDGEVETFFRGILPEDQSELRGPVWELAGLGPMSQAKAAPDAADGRAWTDTAGKDIVRDCLEACGVTDVQLVGGWATFGTVQALVLAKGTNYLSLIQELDAVERCYTLDAPGGRIARYGFGGVPAATFAWEYVEGESMLGSPKRSASTRGIVNRVEVYGSPSLEIAAAREAVSPYLANTVPYRLDSARIDTAEIAQETARLLMLEYNRKALVMSFEVWGNPYLSPGMTIGVRAPSWGITETAGFFIRSLRHTIGRRGFITSLEVEGGQGDEGAPAGLLPVADFTYQVERETLTTGTHYFVYCASKSYDLDTAPDALSLAWRNSANAQVGTGPSYVAVFSSAEAATKPTITLTATDPEENSDEATKTIDAAQGAVLRELYHAYGSRAEATEDGGATWRSWAPGGGVQVLCTAASPPEGKGLWGLSDGRLIQTTDHLQTAPTTRRTFGSGVRSIAVYAQDQKEWWVGLNDGELWRSVDEGATWTRIAWFNNPSLPLVDLYRSSDSRIRICYGLGEFATTLLTPHLISQPIPGVTSFGTAAGRIAYDESGSSAGHYVSGQGPIPIRQSGTGIAPYLGSGLDAAHSLSGMPAEVQDVRALCYDSKRPRLFAVARDGRSFWSDWGVGGRAPWVEETQLPSSAAVEQALHDPAYMGLFYVATADNGLWKTPDSGARWYQLRPHNAGAGLVSHMVGQGRAAIVSRSASGTRALVTGLRGAQACAYWADPATTPGSEWTQVSGGLPSGSGGALDVRLDPANLARAFCRVANLDNTEGADSGLYTNPDYAAGSSWARILSPAQAQALVLANGHVLEADLDSCHIAGFDVGSDGRLYAYLWATSVGAYGLHGYHKSGYLVRSNDKGATWGAASLAWWIDGLMQNGAAIYRKGIVVDPRAPDTVWIIANNSWGMGAAYVTRTTDGGSSWPTEFLYISGFAPTFLLSRVAGSPSGLYLPGGLGAQSYTARLVNGTLTATQTLEPCTAAQAWANPQDTVGFTVQGNGYFYRTTNGASSWGAGLASSLVPTAATSWQAKATDSARHWGTGTAAGQGAYGAEFAVWHTTDFVSFEGAGDPAWPANLTLYGIAIS